MLVRDDDGVEIFGLLADLGQPARQFPHAQTRIDQDPRLRSGEERRVTRTAAREYAKPDQKTILLRFVLAGNSGRMKTDIAERPPMLPLTSFIRPGLLHIFDLMTSTSSFTAPELLWSAAVSSSVSLIS